MGKGNGSVLKRCTCTGADGKRLGQKCPSLRRTSGSWSPHHGTWTYQLELPPTRKGTRRQLKRVPFGDNTRDTAADELEQAKALLLLARGDDDVLDEIATMLQQVKQGIWAALLASLVAGKWGSGQSGKPLCL